MAPPCLHFYLNVKFYPSNFAQMTADNATWEDGRDRDVTIAGRF